MDVLVNALKHIDYAPEQLLTASPRDLHNLFPQPTLIHLQGRNPQPLFVSVQLHGNEPTGFLAIQKLLVKYQQKELPRSLSIFLGNTEAASQNLRRLDNQPDFNRIWPGTELSDSPETRMAHAIVDEMRTRNVFISIDIHNNTGLNPHYGCINSLDNQFVQLARLFSRLVVYFIRPKGVQSAAFAQLCPAITLECGRPDQKNGVEHALEFIDSCLHLSILPDHPPRHQDVDLFHTIALVKIKNDVYFSFEQDNADLLLSNDIERLNFTEISAGTIFGLVKNSHMPLIAINELGKDVTDHLFKIENNNLQAKRKTMPSMLTLDEHVIKQDCLCYLMERLTP